MSRFNVQTTHPLIPNSQEYIYEQQYISIHSEDRNILKHPNASDFEIELPQDYLNVQGFRLVAGYFPAQVNVFSKQRKNVTMLFNFVELYNPNDHGVVDPLQLAIYATLSGYLKNYFILINDGTYTAEQLMHEVVNRMNQAVTDVLLGSTSSLSPAEKTALEAAGGYSEFVAAHNIPSKKLWIGNQSSGFQLLNTETTRYEENSYVCHCSDNNDIVDVFKDWGLPGNLGFTRCDAVSVELTNENDARFFYLSGTSGVWLRPNAALAGAKAYYMTAPLQMDIAAQKYMYMDIKLLNAIDETAPYNYSKYTQETNSTNGVVKASFAKIPLSTDALGGYYEEYSPANYFKMYNPPVERIRKLSIKFRYHDGMLVDFNNQKYTFTIEFTILRPQNNRAYNVRVPVSIGNPV
jgi:hypothetical protein